MLDPLGFSLPLAIIPECAPDFEKIFERRTKIGHFAYGLFVFVEDFPLCCSGEERDYEDTSGLLKKATEKNHFNHAKAGCSSLW